MPMVEVLDLNNRKVGDLELSDAVFGAEVKEHLIYESVRHYMAFRFHENPRGSSGLRKEAVETEGYRAGAHGLRSISCMAEGWHGSRAEAARLFLPSPEKDAVGRATERSFRETAGRRAEGGEGIRPCGPPHEDDGRRTESAGIGGDGAAGR